MPTVMIIGGGLAGPLMARLLAQDGWDVRVYERRSDPRLQRHQGGRSINLALSARGLKGLAAAAIAQRVLDRDAIAMRGRMIHARAGQLAFQPYSTDPHDAIHSVSRAGLNLTLVAAAAELGSVAFHFDHTCLAVDLDRAEATFKTAAGSLVRASADLVLGADGAFSPLRLAMQTTVDRFDLQQSYLAHGYKELSIAPRQELEQRGVVCASAAGLHAMEPEALHIWPRGSSMMIALPNRDGSFTCTLFWPYQGAHGFAALRTAEEVRARFASEYADAVPLMPTLLRDYERNPIGSLVTVRCSPWVWRDRAALLGDAAHAIVPFYGQGMNAAFEDCVTLAQCLRSAQGDRAAALARYQEQRKPDADAIADMALENFHEMRDKVGDPAFLYKKRVEQLLHKLDPAGLVPQYNLVSFSTEPYSHARARGRELSRLYERVIARVPRELAEALSTEEWTRRVREALLVERDGGSFVGLLGEMIDISPAITERTQVWPGDTPPSREVLCDIRAGANITLSTLRTTVHVGAHADAPSHYAADAPGVGEQPLDRYIGECCVIEARTARGGRVAVEDLEGGVSAICAPRVLIKTSTFASEGWNSDFAGLSSTLIEALAQRGVVTVGIDTPSMDPQDSKDLQAHQTILRHGLAILEGLDLRGVAPGEYLLFAQPLKLIGFDASPVRAVLARAD